jgi:two-component system chemotaxis response regulator CheY
MKILIVDDSKAMRMIVRRTLQQAGFDQGHDVSEATNGAEALGAIRTGRPDLVLCDWNMPEMSGIELLTALRAEGVNVKFGFVTSEGTERMRAEAGAAGALFLISKPFTADDFRTTLASVLG